MQPTVVVSNLFADLWTAKVNTLAPHEHRKFGQRGGPPGSLHCIALQVVAPAFLADRHYGINLEVPQVVLDGLEFALRLMGADALHAA